MSRKIVYVAIISDYVRQAYVLNLNMLRLRFGISADIMFYTMWAS